MVDLYPIPIVITPSIRPAPQVVSRATVQRWARETGNHNAHRQDVAAVTVPVITVDQRGLHYEQRQGQEGIEFRFQSGVLRLHTWHRIFISNTLSPCERRIWSTHELEHVRDNERLADRLMLRIQSDSYMQSIFVRRQWLPRDSFDLIQDSTEETCARIYRELTAEAVQRRDTASEYRRIRTLIRTTCGRVPRRHHSRAGAQARR